MKSLVRALVRWFWLLLLFLLAGYFGGTILARQFPPTYQATSIIQLNTQTQSNPDVQPIGNYAALITSDSILDTVLKKYSHIDRGTFVTRELMVSSDSTAQTISVQVTFPDAKTAVGIADDLAQELVLQQNASIKSHHAEELRLVNARINGEQAAIVQLNQEYAATSTTNKAALRQINNQIVQHESLLAQDDTTRQTLLMKQALYDAPFSVAQPAIVPIKAPSLIELVPFTAQAALLALMAAIVTICILEKRAGRVRDAFALRQKTSLPVLGTIRWAKPIPLNALPGSMKPFAEDCRVMMTDVLFHAVETKARRISITSLRPHAGTSCVAAQLAALLAHNQRRVLLIDANLYRPSLNERFELPRDGGLAAMLETTGNKVMNGSVGALKQTQAAVADHFHFDGLIKSTPVENLYLVSAGNPSVKPGVLLSRPAMAEFLNWVSNSVDFVLIDCPELTNSESRLLGALCDQTLLVIDATKDGTKQVLNMKTALLNTGVKLSGLIVNKFGRWV